MKILLTLAFISRETVLLLAAIPVSLAVGFALGLLYERWYNFSAVQRMTKRFDKLFLAVSKSLDKAERACRVFNQHPQCRELNPKQRAAMQSLSGKLTGELKQISAACENLADQKKANRSNSSSKPEKKKLKPFHLPDWSLTPKDARTDFPDATAYQSNLELLLAAMQQTDSQSAVLFVKLDHYSRHAQTYGGQTADAFLKKTASIVLRKLRQQDFIAQITDDLLIAIIPDIQSASMQQMAGNARKAVRAHRFINPESEQEVFVTASFSYTMFGELIAKNDSPEQELWDRCQNALAASQKQGRCQLHEMTDMGISRLIAG